MTSKQAFVYGGMLIFFGILGLVQIFTELNTWTWAALLGVAALVIFAVYVTDRSDWSLLIPAYVLLDIAIMITLVDLNLLRGEAVATFVLWSISLPFFIVVVRDWKNRWALIPAYTLFVVGAMVGLIGVGILHDLLIPAYVMLVISIPFFAVYVLDRTQRWPLIPAGILFVLSIGFLFSGNALQYIVPVAMLAAGVVLILIMVKR